MCLWVISCQNQWEKACQHDDWSLVYLFGLFPSMSFLAYQLILKKLRWEKIWQMSRENHRWNHSVSPIHTEKPCRANSERIIKQYLIQTTQTAGLSIHAALAYCGMTWHHVCTEQLRNIFKVLYEYFLQSLSLIFLLQFLPFFPLNRSKCNWQSIINWLESWN